MSVNFLFTLYMLDLLFGNSYTWITSVDWRKSFIRRLRMLKSFSCSICHSITHTFMESKSWPLIIQIVLSISKTATYFFFSFFEQKGTYLNIRKKFKCKIIENKIKICVLNTYKFRHKTFFALNICIISKIYHRT